MVDLSPSKRKKAAVEVLIFHIQVPSCHDQQHTAQDQSKGAICGGCAFTALLDLIVWSLFSEPKQVGKEMFYQIWADVQLKTIQSVFVLSISLIFRPFCI